MERWNDKWDALNSDDSEDSDDEAVRKWKEKNTFWNVKKKPEQQKVTKRPESPKKTKDEGCANCGKISVDLKKCTKCQAVKYCDRKCQRAHWASHHRFRCCSLIDERLIWLEFWEPKDPGVEMGKDVARQLTKDDKLPSPQVLMDVGEYGEEMCRWVRAVIDDGSLRRLVEKWRGRRLIMYIERPTAMKRIDVNDLHIYDHYDINETISSDGTLFNDKVRRLGSKQKATDLAALRHKIFYLTLRRIYSVNPQENFLLVYTDTGRPHPKRRDDLCMKFPFDVQPGNEGRFVGR